MAYFLTAACLFMMSARKYSMAYHNSAIVGIVFLFAFSLLYGENNQTHVFLLLACKGIHNDINTKPGIVNLIKSFIPEIIIPFAAIVFVTV